MATAPPRPRMALAACLALLLPTLGAAADAPVAQVRAETIFLRVSVGADGHVLSATPFDDHAAMSGVAQQYASKLVFTPAKREGRPVPAATCLTVRLAAEPRPDGTFGVKLRRAISGPCVEAVGKTEPPKVGRDNGALVVIGARLRADGRVDEDSLTLESAQLRVPSSFAEARYREAAEKSLRGSRFKLDTVDGVPVPSHVSVPFQFGSGPGKPKPGEEGKRGAPPPESSLPSWNATSLLPTLELAKLDYTAD